mmetsp:Transcript_16844/g.46250  ORF Transcript_16844/g.46250 Transcript_16844/m.46250 type:complete len:264 (+) Transcript_16844:1548-2339(+)
MTQDVSISLLGFDEIDLLDLGDCAGALVDVVAEGTHERRSANASLAQNGYQPLVQFEQGRKDVIQVHFTAQKKLRRSWRRIFLHHVSNAQFRALGSQRHSSGRIISTTPSSTRRSRSYETLTPMLFRPFSYGFRTEYRFVMVTALGKQYKFLHFFIRIFQVGCYSHGLAALVEGFFHCVPHEQCQIERPRESKCGRVLEFGLLLAADNVRNSRRRKRFTGQTRVASRNKHKFEWNDSVLEDKFLNVLDAQPIGASHSVFERQK